jgi:hypothetical protein
MKHIKDKYAGKTFAEVASEIDKKYKKRKVDNTQAKSYEMEMAELMRMNESAKQAEATEANVKEMLKCGGKLKMQFGGFPDPPGVPPGNTDWIAQQQLGLLNPLPTGDGSLATDNTLLTGNKAMLANPLPRNTGIATDNTVLTTNNRMIENPLPGLGGVATDNTALTGNNQITLGQNVAPIIGSDGQFKGIDNPKPDYVKERKPGILDRLFGKESNIYNPAYAGQLANLGINAGILAGGYDKELPQTNKYESDVRRLMQGRGVDNTAVQNRINAQANAGRENLQNVRSANVRNALDQNLSASTMDASANAELQQQQMNNQYTADYASTLNNLGMQDSQARVLAQELTARNKGNYQTMLSQFGQGIAENSKFFTRLKANDRMNQLYTQIINQSAEDFGISEGLMDKLKTGKELTPDDIIQLKSSRNSTVKQFAEFYANSNPSTSQTSVSQNSTQPAASLNQTPAVTTVPEIGLSDPIKTETPVKQTTAKNPPTKQAPKTGGYTPTTAPEPKKTDKSILGLPDEQDGIVPKIYPKPPTSTNTSASPSSVNRERLNQSLLNNARTTQNNSKTEQINTRLQSLSSASNKSTMIELIASDVAPDAKININNVSGKTVPLDGDIRNYLTNSKATKFRLSNPKYNDKGQLIGGTIYEQDR